MNKLTTPQFRFIQADYAGYANSVAQLRYRYLDYPRNISIETQVKCNAKCSFCPYPTTSRQGQEMPTKLFYKLLDDLGEIPSSHGFGITLHRINEPLLDRRLPEFHQAVADRFPQAHHQFWSNGSTIKQGTCEWMALYRNASLTVSLNSVDEAEHTNLMGFGLSVVLKNLDYLHALKAANQFNLPVLLCAPYQHEENAEIFTEFCKSRWPLFSTGIRPFFSWMGESSAGAAFRENLGLPASANETEIFGLPCGQWFDLHILADGSVTKCCIDESGYRQPNYDATKRNVLDIFRDRIKQRRELPKRSSIIDCQQCLHLG